MVRSRSIEVPISIASAGSIDIRRAARALDPASSIAIGRIGSTKSGDASPRRSSKLRIESPSAMIARAGLAARERCRTTRPAAIAKIGSSSSSASSFATRRDSGMRARSSICSVAPRRASAGRRATLIQSSTARDHLRMLRLPIACTIGLLSFSSTAQAEPSILWPETNPRFHWVEYGFTSAVLLISIFNEQLVPGVERELWHGGILFDESLDRWAIGLQSPANDGFTRAGDVAMYGPVAFPFRPDARLDPGRWNGGADVAWQIAMISGEALLTSSLLNLLAKRYVTRNRPATPRCQAGEECPTGSAIHSFYSG